jgi:hypothetical protein
MRMVIDSNILQAAELRHYLSAKKANIAVLPDFIFVEAYKPRSVPSVCKSMAILCEFPNQVIVLKPTKKCSGLSGRLAGLQRRLIHEEGTRQFGRYAQLLQRARDGDIDAIHQIESDFGQPSAHIDGLADEAIGLGSRIDEFISHFSPADRASIRDGRVPSSEGIRHALRKIVTTTYEVLESHPNVHRWPEKHELINTFIFRACLCQILLAMDLGSRGAQAATSIKKMVNHQMDAFIAAYATYFDGVHSNDKQLARTHRAACTWIAAFRGSSVGV